MDAETLSKMLNAKPSGKGFIALCPAHNDKNPSLSITDGDNGLTLINCFAGCSAETVVSSMGLEIKDLYQESSFTSKQHREYEKVKNLSERWKALNQELHVLLQIVSNRVCDKTLSKDQQFTDYRPDFKPLPVEFWEREILAANRVKNLIGDIYEL